MAYPVVEETFYLSSFLLKSSCYTFAKLVYKIYKQEVRDKDKYMYLDTKSNFLTYIKRLCELKTLLKEDFGRYE